MSGQMKFHVGFGVNNTDFYYLGPQVLINTGIYGRSDYFFSIRPEFKLTKRVKLSTDIQYSNKRLDITYYQWISRTEKYRFTYLELIPQVQYQIFSNFCFYGGTGIAFRLEEQENINLLWMTTNSKTKNSVDLSYLFGLRLTLWSKISLHTHFAAGLFDYLNIEFVDNRRNPIVFNHRMSNLQLGMAYQLN